jgi:hypothetical protein
MTHSSPHAPHLMKTRRLIVFIVSLVTIASLGSALAAPSPFKKASNDLERAHRRGGRGAPAVINSPPCSKLSIKEALKRLAEVVARV